MIVTSNATLVGSGTIEDTTTVGLIPSTFILTVLATLFKLSIAGILLAPKIVPPFKLMSVPTAIPSRSSFPSTIVLWYFQ